eukprot:TRINITY_DN38621_c0_g1_i1.p1 TRINITY_DN38621_c0_g1~~TRINITY_DN38621_c0_g1_i1.p1  ORF type:complete len:256 (-),score=35.41 TRINITY_DN38621_c0_g1_i1:511-1209(-)
MVELFEKYRTQVEEDSSVREKIRNVVSEMDATSRLMQATLLPVYSGSKSVAEQAVARTRSHIPALQKSYADLAEILKERPGEYYRFNDHWRTQSSSAAFILAFVHWLETGTLLSYSETEAQLHLDHDVFGLELEDYLTGLCSVSNELPRYVVNRVTAGEYDCPRRVSEFLSQLYGGFRLLNLRNDFLRKRYDGLKYDLKKVEEVLYDVKIRGLLGDVKGVEAGGTSESDLAV